ncbi:hypothetical protein CcarbDRAFT_1808 [Clostridium carboxidivorans P7]|uniref:Uncharacterized protein n=1 Tax=Clostridium carboxidivorans P7 TaxID=536227 RepID=C6PSP1_9CLOT|nr:hypothetical protein [Clostridium carboxidivorans]EET87720.1 hypothetical protein CcarbDRAFT_1808 [Clostridium carboxidivorans P7]
MILCESLTPSTIGEGVSYKESGGISNGSRSDKMIVNMKYDLSQDDYCYFQLE